VSVGRKLGRGRSDAGPKNAQAAGERVGRMRLEKPCTPDKLIGCLKK